MCWHSDGSMPNDEVWTEYIAIFPMQKKVDFARQIELFQKAVITILT